MATVNSSTTLGDYTLANNMKNVLVYIGKTFIDTDHRTIYLGQIDDSMLLTKTDSSQLNFVEALIKGYPSFKARFASSMKNIGSINLKKDIMIRNLTDNIYKPLNSTSSFASTNTEINFSKILQPSSELLSILDMIRNTYTFLQDDTLKNYTAGVTFSVSNYSINDSNYSYTQITPEGVPMFLAKINDVVGDMRTFDYVKNDVFMIRRLMLLYELIANIYISMYLYDLAVENNQSDDVNSFLLDIISKTGDILVNLNKNFMFTSDDDAPTRAKISADLNEKAQSVQRSSEQINLLDEKVRDLKSALSSNNDIFNSKYMKSKKAGYYEYAFVGIFILSLIVIIGVSVSPIDRSTKLTTNVFVLLILIVSAYFVDYLYRRNIEGFAVASSGTNLEYGKKQGIVGTVRDKKNDDLAVFDNTYKGEAVSFLSISIYLALLLQSGRTYSSIDAAIKREISYFTKMSGLVDNTNDKVSNATNLAYLDTMMSAARISFFVSLGIIIGGTIIAYVIIGDNIKYQPYILGAAGLLILIALSRYLYETSKYVRNDASKFYWSKPNEVSEFD